jgi:hypothetical protein
MSPFPFQGFFSIDCSHLANVSHDHVKSIKCRAMAFVSALILTMLEPTHSPWEWQKLCENLESSVILEA